MLMPKKFTIQASDSTIVLRRSSGSSSRAMGAVSECVTPYSAASALASADLPWAFSWRTSSCSLNWGVSLSFLPITTTRTTAGSVATMYMPRQPSRSSSRTAIALEIRKPSGQPPWTMPYQKPRWSRFFLSSVIEKTSLRYVALTDCSENPRPPSERTPMTMAELIAPSLAGIRAVSSDATAVPPMVSCIPRRRPSRSMTGPTPNATTAVPTAISVLIRYDVESLHPKSLFIAGSSVPNSP